MSEQDQAPAVVDPAAEEAAELPADEAAEETEASVSALFAPNPELNPPFEPETTAPSTGAPPADERGPEVNYAQQLADLASAAVAHLEAGITLLHQHVDVFNAELLGHEARVNQLVDALRDAFGIDDEAAVPAGEPAAETPAPGA